MNSLIDTIEKVRAEIAMGDQCLVNILARLDDDIARIQERKQQITDEFAARRRAPEDVIGERAAIAPVTEEVNHDAD